jgi:hypothetical protein
VADALGASAGPTQERGAEATPVECAPSSQETEALLVARDSSQSDDARRDPGSFNQRPLGAMVRFGGIAAAYASGVARATFGKRAEAPTTAVTTAVTAMRRQATPGGRRVRPVASAAVPARRRTSPTARVPAATWPQLGGRSSARVSRQT